MQVSKINKNNKSNKNRYLRLARFTLGILFCSTISSIISVSYAGGPEPAPVLCNPPGNIYLGVFGGVAASNTFDVRQYGTAFYPDVVGGPLAVNAFGTFGDQTSGLVGGQIGYQWGELVLSPNWGLAPAIELEGYYLTQTSLTGQDVNNDTTRLPEHNFVVTYPIETGVFLTNAVLHINSLFLGRFHPYVGVGLGGAVASITNATATQIAPPEPGINHFNSNPSDTAATFAAQAKLGLSFYLCKTISLFAEYRFLYLSSTNYTFGSTVYPGHPATSSWQVKMDPRYYNAGVLGIQFNV